MSQNLVQSLNTSLAARKKAAVEKYRTIIDRAGSPESTDLDELKALMAELGISAAEVESDVIMSARVRQLKSVCLTDEQADTLNRDAEARRATLLESARKGLAKLIQKVPASRLGDLINLAVDLTGDHESRALEDLNNADRSPMDAIRTVDKSDEAYRTLEQIHAIRPFLVDSRLDGEGFVETEKDGDE